MFTSGYELTTSLTNVIIFICSLYCYLNIKSKNLWKFFYLTVVIDSLLGSIVHGIVLSKNVVDILWIFLAFAFTFTINTLLCIYLKLNMKHILVLSILLFILLGVQMLYNIDFLFTFTMYALLVLVISTYYVIRTWNEKSKWIIMGFIFQVIGGILMLCKCKFMMLNHNGIYHMFMVITLIFIYIGVKEKRNAREN